MIYLIELKNGYPAYNPSKFDVILFSYILNINVILLRTSISEVIGPGIIDSELYFVLYHNIKDSNMCIPFIFYKKNQNH